MPGKHSFRELWGCFESFDGGKKIGGKTNLKVLEGLEGQSVLKCVPNFRVTKSLFFRYFGKKVVSGRNK